MQIITSSHDLNIVLQHLLTADVVAVDTEFMREKTYWPQLCLLQIACARVAGEPDVFLIDPLPEALDLRPLNQLWGSASILKVFHAGSQDIELLYHVCGTPPAPLFDTQDAAALIGLPEQIGYGALVQRLLNVELAKTASFTNWARRPLTDDQLHYAAEDVTWLFKLYPVLQAELAKLGRERWLESEFALRAKDDTLRIDPRKQFLRLKRVASLKSSQLAIAQEVAAWREEEAMRLDIPKRWLLSDEAVLEIARRAPQNAGELRDLRGVEGRINRSLNAVIAAVKRGQAMPREKWPRLKARRSPEGDFSAVIELMTALVRKRAGEHRLSPAQLATRSLLENLVSEHGENSPLLTGWRRQLIGEELLLLLDGKLRLSLRDSLLVIEEV